jgi:hypothetical protein
VASEAPLERKYSRCGQLNFDDMRIALIIFFQLTTLSLSAQTLFDIYLMLPEKVGLGDRSTRELMIKNYHAGDKSLQGNINYRFDTVDERNGFLSVTGAMEGQWEMCYWNTQRNKLIAIYFQGCGPVCYIEEFKFFILQDNKLFEQKIENIIPGYKSIYNDFFIDYSENTKKELREKDIIATLLFKIPRKGKDIIAFFGNEDSKETYSKFSKGDRMLLKWDNGKFIKDKIFWSE